MYPPVMYIWYYVTQKQPIEEERMKILKYKLATEINHGTPEKPLMGTVLSDVFMPYITEADYQLALSEAGQDHRGGGGG